MSDMRFERTTMGGLWEEPIVVAHYKECQFDIAEFPQKRELNIQFAYSANLGHGEAQEAVGELLRLMQGVPASHRWAGWSLVSSVPISPAWQHIANKFGLKIYEAEFEAARKGVTG